MMLPAVKASVLVVVGMGRPGHSQRSLEAEPDPGARTMRLRRGLAAPDPWQSPSARVDARSGSGRGRTGASRRPVRDAYGLPKIAWPPTRRQRTAGSPSISVHSKVARPSGPEKLHVISQTPGAPATSLTRSERGHGVDGSARHRSQGGRNWLVTTSRNVALSSAESRAQSASNAGMSSNFKPPTQVCAERSRWSKSASGPSTRVTRPAATCSSTSRSMACQRSSQNQRWSAGTGRTGRNSIRPSSSSMIWSWAPG